MAAEAARTQAEKNMKKTDLAASLRLAGAGATLGKRPERVGKKGFVVYLDPELLHQVKTVALAERKTLQQIGMEALEEFLSSRGSVAAGDHHPA